MEEQERVIRAVNQDADIAEIVVLGVPHRPGATYRIFAGLAAAAIDVDMIIQGAGEGNRDRRDIAFTVSKADLALAQEIAEAAVCELGGSGVVVAEDLAKVSVIGAGMYGRPGIAAAMFRALAAAGVNIEAIGTSEISISCLVAANQAAVAVKGIHAQFFPPDEE